ncbi:hypothetical protein GCM10027597_51830 [Saccharopolyspora tripterygii]
MTDPELAPGRDPEYPGEKALGGDRLVGRIDGIRETRGALQHLKFDR